MDRKYVLVSFIFAIAGLCLGIYMAISKNHGQFITHAHIMLVGFVLSFMYGLCHKLWLENIANLLARLQFFIHLVGAIVLSVGLFLGYGNFVSLETLDPALAIGSISVLTAVILMLVLFLKSSKST